MTYAELLQGIIDESGLSLRQISHRCEGLNLSITPSYISQLKNSKLPPPSEEVSLTLAKVCGAKNPAELVFQGYMEKAPDLVKEYMLASSSLNRTMMETICKISGQELQDDMKKTLEQMDVLSALNLSSEFVNVNNSEDINGLVQKIFLACGGVSKADTKGEQVTQYVADDSMEPALPVHSFVYIMPTREDLLKDRDIIAFYPDNRKIPMLRRIFFVKDKILLIPDNREFDTLIFDDMSQIDYIGKIVSFKVDL